MTCDSTGMINFRSRTTKPPWSSRMIIGSATPIVKKAFVYVTLPLTILGPPVGCSTFGTGVGVDEDTDVGVTCVEAIQALIARLRTAMAVTIRVNKGFISFSSL